MKHLNRILYAVLPVLCLLSCDNEPIDFTLRDDLPEPVTDSIVGEWELIGVNLQNATASYEVFTDSITKDVNGESSDYDMNIAFYEDHTTSFTGSYLQTFNLDLGLSTSSETIAIDAEDLFSSGTWSRTTTLLEISDDDKTQEIEILELTNNLLRLQFSETQKQMIQGILVNLEADYILSFERTE